MDVPERKSGPLLVDLDLYAAFDERERLRERFMRLQQELLAEGSTRETDIRRVIHRKPTENEDD